MCSNVHINVYDEVSLSRVSYRYCSRSRGDSTRSRSRVPFAERVRETEGRSQVARGGSTLNALLAENERNEHPRAIANTLVGWMAGFFLASGF